MSVRTSICARHAVAAALALAVFASAAPAQKPGARQAPQQDEQASEVTIVNRSRVQIDVINISPVVDTNWGQDYLGRGVLPPGRQQRFRIEDPQGCAYDIRAVYQDRREEEFRNVDICRNRQITFTGQNARAAGQQARPQQPAAAQGDPDFVLVNNSRLRIASIQASPVTDTQWGEDRLRGEIPVGGRFVVRLNAPGVCQWDVRVVFHDQTAEERRNVDLCQVGDLAFDGSEARPAQGAQAQTPPAQSPPAQSPPQQGQARPQAPQQPQQAQRPQRTDPSVVVQNQGPAEILELYAAPQNATSWGPDRLGRDTLPARRTFNLALPADQGCVWHLRVVFFGGRDEERRSQNLCAMETVSFAGQIPAGVLLSTGTGFYISRDGHILTNRHVVENCNTVAIARPNGQRLTLRRLGEDAVNDLALLQLPGIVSPAAVFRAAGTPMRAGDRVVVVGYPARQVLGDVNVTEGLVSALRGPRGDTTLFQYTAPTQGGNSGGPIFDEHGLVAGVVVSGYEQLPGGRQAQNINFGIQLDIARRFVQSLGVTLQESPPGESRRTSDIAERATPVVLPLDCLS
jgi:S1-C subfamily serine protease